MPKKIQPNPTTPNQKFLVIKNKIIRIEADKLISDVYNLKETLFDSCKFYLSEKALEAKEDNLASFVNCNFEIWAN